MRITLLIFSWWYSTRLSNLFIMFCFWSFVKFHWTKPLHPKLWHDKPILVMTNRSKLAHILVYRYYKLRTNNKLNSSQNFRFKVFFSFQVQAMAPCFAFLGGLLVELCGTAIIVFGQLSKHMEDTHKHTTQEWLTQIFSIEDQIGCWCKFQTCKTDLELFMLKNFANIILRQINNESTTNVFTGWC